MGRIKRKKDEEKDDYKISCKPKKHAIKRSVNIRERRLK